MALVEGETLVARARHHLHVADRVAWLSQALQPVHLPAAGVGQVERLVHRVHGQVVLVCRTGAGDGKKKRVLHFICFRKIETATLDHLQGTGLKGADPLNSSLLL